MTSHSKAHARAGEPVDVRVRTKHMVGALRVILGMRPADDEAEAARKTRNSPRLAVQLPFTYRVVRQNFVLPETYSGTVLNIGYHGMLVELEQPLPANTEIKLNLEALLDYAKAPDIDAKASEFYAKITDTRPVDARSLSGMVFICVSPQSDKLLTHAMLHLAHAGNTLLDQHLWQHDRTVTKKTDAWQITKRIILGVLLAASTALLYLVWILNDALIAMR